MLSAALTSLSCSDPQVQQVHERTDSGISSAFSPQSEHVFDVAAHRSSLTICLPARSAL
jgi:hypothetical protein